jgi:DNA-binding NarL/FixJ family response regulator
MSSRRIRVMLVDDHVLVREGLRGILEQQPDIEVVAEAGDGEAALVLAMDLEPDAVLMDVRMPVMDGIEATRRLRAAHPQMPVLVLSAFPDFALEALRAGAAGYVMKSGRARQLVAALRSVVQGSTVIDEGLVSSQVLGTVGRHPAPNDLSPREDEVLRLVAGGLTNRTIARQMGIAPRTADQHVHNILVKIGAKSRADAVRYAIEHELMSFGPAKEGHQPVPSRPM